MCINSSIGIQVNNDFKNSRQEAINRIIAECPEEYKVLRNLLKKTNVVEVGCAPNNYGFEEDGGSFVENGQFKFKVVYQYNDVLDLPIFEANTNPRQFVWCFKEN